jgi:hypothetical protein
LSLGVESSRGGSDESFGSGTKSTADAEARDITSFVSSSAARDEANKDVAGTEKLLQLPSKARMTQLSMAGGE